MRWGRLCVLWAMSMMALHQADGAVPQHLSTEPNHSKKATLTLYYEAMCPDSRHLLLRILNPVYSALADLLNLNLIPFGKGFVSSTSRSISCHHGPPECLAHLTHACLMHHVKNFSVTWELLNCLMTSNMADPLQTLAKCSESWPIDHVESVEKCIFSNEGFELMVAMANMTMSRRLKSVPQLTLDNQVIDWQSKENLFNDVCRQLRKRNGDLGSRCTLVI